MGPRDEHGRFIKRDCVDPNCNGRLVPDKARADKAWACDGLTHGTDTGPLVACDYAHWDGEPAEVSP